MEELTKALHELMLEHQRNYAETATTKYLAEQLGVTQPALDRHFKILQAAGLAVRQSPPLREAWRAIEKENESEN